MGRATLEERLLKTELQEQKLLEKAKQIQARKKQLEQEKKADDRKKRTRRLIQIGAAVESVLNKEINEDDIPKLIEFLRRQESNGRYFSRAMGYNE